MDMKYDREVLGERLRTLREKKGLSAYRVAKKGDIQAGQVKVVEQGGSNYTIDTLLGYLQGCGLAISVIEKDSG